MKIERKSSGTRSAFHFIFKLKATLFHLLSFNSIRCTTACHSLPLTIICYQSLSFAASRFTTRCHSLHHSLSLVVPLAAVCCHSFSFAFTCSTTRYHLMNHSMYTTRLSFYKRSFYTRRK